MCWPRRTIGIVGGKVSFWSWAAVGDFVADVLNLLEQQTISEERNFVKTLQCEAWAVSEFKNSNRAVRKVVEVGKIDQNG